MLCILLTAVLIVTLFWWWILYAVQWGLPLIPGTNRCLLVIAHPDDETMFFGPTIRQLLKANVHIFVLSISCGNADGLGM